MSDKIKSLYAIPCSSPGDEELFFLTFQTRDEDEALSLAACVHGSKGKRALVIINEDGEIFTL